MLYPIVVLIPNSFKTCSLISFVFGHCYYCVYLYNLVFLQMSFHYHSTVPVLSGHLKIDETNVLIVANSSLMKVKSIAEFCNTFDLH